MNGTDQSTAVRRGEELDQDRLTTFLRQALPEIQGPLEIEQFPAGFSNLTYLVRSGGRQLVLRRPPFGSKPKSGHDMQREFTVLSALTGSTAADPLSVDPLAPDHPTPFGYAPRPLVFCDDESVLGCPFYIMERIEGIIVRRDLPKEVEFAPHQMQALCERWVDVLVELHAVDYDAAGLGELGKPDGYVERQVHGWCKRYRRSRTDDVPDGETIMEWLVEEMPADNPGSPNNRDAALIHNDYKLDNVVLSPQQPTEIIGVLDWEMTTLGNPLMDLGCSLAYWVEASDSPEELSRRSMPTHLPGALTRQQIIERYAERSGRAVTSIDFFYTFGLFRLAVIVQQIYYRYVHGQTQDPRFSQLGHWVTALQQSAERVIVA